MSLRNSIAVTLIRIIFSVYFAVTVVVTAAQLVAEYRDLEQRFYSELQSLEPTFRDGIDDAVWHFNRDGLAKILHGMLENPLTLGVEVRDWSRVILAQAGDVRAVVTANGWPTWFADPITVTFPVTYRDEQGNSHHLGEWSAYSNRALVFERLDYRVRSILVASSIKALILLIVFLVVVDRTLGRPLKRLRRELGAVNAATEATHQRVSLGIGGPNELTLVEDTINAALDRLRQSNQELRNLAARQEQLIDERTQELQAANAELGRLSETDALTGLCNRRRLETAMHEEWRHHRRSGNPLSAIMLDVDHFKAYNDACGHRAGDDCLRHVAEIIVSCVHRPGDIAARYGGEEFLILLPETDAAGAITVAEGIREATLTAHIPHPQSPVSATLTISLGTATIFFNALHGEEPPGGPEALIDMADKALYTAKKYGRNQVVCYNGG